MSRLNIERQEDLEPKRMEYAKEQVQALGYVIKRETTTSILFEFNGHDVTLFPYSGWHTGKSIKDGRGIENLIEQLKK